MSLLQNLIEEFKNIYVFVHQNPDRDAFGSAYGLECFINDNYPDKEVTVVTNDDIIISGNSLAIIVDCAVADRVLNQSYVNCKSSIVIDHHPKRVSYGDYDITKVSAAATCELLTELLMEFGKINDKCAFWLYSGLLTDTINFTTASTSSNTLLIASKLLAHNINVVKLQEELFGKDLKEFKFETFVKSLANYQEKIITVKISKETVIKNGVTMDFAKGCVRCFTGIKGVKIVVLFYEDINTGKYNASIRSKEVVVNTTANKYGGGGHDYASGVKDLDDKSMTSLVTDLKKLL